MIDSLYCFVDFVVYMAIMSYIGRFKIVLSGEEEMVLMLHDCLSCATEREYG